MTELILQPTELEMDLWREGREQGKVQDDYWGVDY